MGDGPDAGRLAAAIAGRLMALGAELDLQLAGVIERCGELAAGGGWLRVTTDDTLSWIEILTPENDRPRLWGLRLDRDGLVYTVREKPLDVRADDTATDVHAALDELSQHGVAARAIAALATRLRPLATQRAGWHSVEGGPARVWLELDGSQSVEAENMVSRGSVTAPQRHLFSRVHPILMARSGFHLAVAARGEELIPGVTVAYPAVPLRKTIRLLSSLFPDKEHARVIGAFEGALGNKQPCDLRLVLRDVEPIASELAFHCRVRP